MRISLQHHNLKIIIMKRVKNLTLAALITVIGAGVVVAKDGVTSTTFKGDGSQVHLVQGKEARYRLIYPVKEKGTIKVKLYNSQNDLLLSDRLDTKEGFIRPYDLSELPQGKYRMVIWEGEKKFSHELNLNGSSKPLSVSFDRIGDAASYKLVVKGVDASPVYVDIFGREGSLVADRITVGKDFSRVYTFKELSNEDLVLKVSHNDEVFVSGIK